MATADTVTVELEAKTAKYLADISNAESVFGKKMAEIQASADAAGTATSVVFDKASGTFKQAGQAAAAANTQLKALNGTTGNIASQFNDIGVSLQGGQSFLTVALQQGTQLSQVFNQIAQAQGGAGGKGGVAGVFSAIGSAAAQAVNPISLLTIGAIAAGGALVQYVLSLKTEVPDADKVLKEHGQFIQDIKAYYEGDEEAVKKYGETAGIVLDRIRKQQLKNNEAAAKDQNAGFFETVGVVNQSITGGERFDIARQFLPVKDAINDFREQLKSGRADFDSFNSAIENSNLTEALKTQLITGANELRAFYDAVTSSSEPIDQAKIAYGQLTAAIEAIDSKEAQKALKELGDQAIEGSKTTAQVETALNQLAQANPTMSGPILALQSIINKAREAAGAVAGVGSGQAAPTTGRNLLNENDFNNRFGDKDSQLNQLKEANAKIQAEEDRAAKAAGAARKKAAHEAAKEDPFERFNRSIQERTAVAEQEYNAQAKVNPLIDDYGYALNAAKLYQEGLNAAAKAGIDLSPQQLAALQSQTQGLASMRAEQARLEEEQQKTKQSFEDWNNTAKEAVGGFINDLANGVSASKALANALSKVVDQLIQVGLNSIFDSKSGIFGGGGGGFNLMSLFGFRANGGPVRAGQPYVVGERGPELFMPGKSGSIIPKLPSVSAGGGGSQPAGGHLTVGVAVDDDGSIRAYVKNYTEDAISQSQQGEVARLPGNLRSVQSRGLI